MSYHLCEKYEKLKKFGHRLSEMKDSMDWDRIKPLISDLYKNETEKGDRQNCTVLLNTGKLVKRIKCEMFDPLPPVRLAMATITPAAKIKA
ncbi:MAG: hypothetical protein M1301_03880 [Candidatus Thermoplasmatota archaeon]|nr:hypothetical protein [Candidatus Thermoplasmatota archaeon]